MQVEKLSMHEVQCQCGNAKQYGKNNGQTAEKRIHGAGLILAEEGFCAAGNGSGQTGTLALLQKDKENDCDGQNDLHDADYQI